MTAEPMTILIADDEKNIREGLSKVLQLGGYVPQMAASGSEALRVLESRAVDLVISDLRMPGLSGEQLLKRVVASYPAIPVIILTGHGTIESAVTAMRDGAYDFLEKPVNLERLALLVERALAERKLTLSNRALRRELERQQASRGLLGNSAAMHRVFEMVEQVAPSRASVLITGESGAGKEVVAEAIHRLSPRAEQPLIKVHCAALAETLLESELFGHEKGAFTGAAGRKRGRFELAHTGTIFLDEIGEISPAVQIKLLRVLQDRAFERVGGEERVQVDVRIIAATNRDLTAETKVGRFRDDLFYRLNVVSIPVPPLRERREDIPILAAAMLKNLAAENNKEIDGFDVDASQRLWYYGWPGNVRELHNAIESAVVMTRGSVITAADLPPHIRDPALDAIVTTESGDAEVRLAVGSLLADAERELIRYTLVAHRGNKTKAAAVLGIGRKTLHRKLAEYRIESDP
jgi:DNA-binding NtrC family response regulator